VTVSGVRYSPNFSSTLLTFGLRVYFSENEPRRLAEQDDPVPNRFYMGVRVGGSLLTDGQWEHGVSLDPESSAAWNTLNQVGGLSLGANFGTHLGVEFAFDLNEYVLDVEGHGHIGEYSVYRLLPQLRLRWPMSRGRLVPYILAGGGVTYDEFNDRKPNGGGLDVDTLAWHPAVTAGAGLEYFLVRNFSINADVRWLYTWGHSLSIDGGPAAKGDFSDVQFFLGFRVYLFNL
jgi:opacity protein-like surface antigen